MRRLALLLAVLWGGPAAAVECENFIFEGHSMTACRVDAATEDLRLFHRDAAGRVLGSFGAVAGVAGPLDFAMNAGMYHPDRRAVGLYVENGQEQAPIVTRDGPGNFGLLPNGVLCLTDDSARVIESRAFDRDRPACRDASQSGPMLVIDGALHPRFLPASTSAFVRNGVGTSADGRTAVFVIANDPVNFHTFARVFRDVFGTPNALYFDGKVSRLYAPALGRDDLGFQLGPIVGVVRPPS